MKNRIAFLSTMGGYPWGGSEELWAAAAGRFLAEGRTVIAWVKRWAAPRPRIDVLQKSGCLLHYWPDVPSFSRRILRRLKVLQPASFQWLERFKPDLAVISMGSHLEGGLVYPAILLMDCPYVIIVQSAGAQMWPLDSDLDFFVEFYQKARACFFVSQNNLQLVETQLGCSLPNARVVRNPFNVRYETFHAWPNDEKDIKLACVARLDPDFKGQDLILQVLRQQKWQKRALTVSFFGSGYRSRSLQRLADLYALSNVRFMGFQSDVEEIWSQHHGLVLASRYEGLPIVIVEAMLSGRICIVTDIAGNSELLQDNQSGFVAAGPTVTFLDEAMERAWSRRNEWRELGQIAARRVRDHVSADPVGDFVNELKALL